MTQQVVIDLSKMVGSESYPDFMRLHHFTNQPVFEEMMEVIESGAVLSDELKARMTEVVKHYANTHPESEQKMDPVERVSNIGDNLFQPEKIMALALQNANNPDECRRVVEDTFEKYKAEQLVQSKKDIEREGFVIGETPPIRISNPEDLMALFPELSGEQRDYIMQIGSQAFITDSGSQTLIESAGTNGAGLVQARDSKDVTLHIQIDDGKVRLVSSKNFNRVDPMDPEEVLGVITSTQIADITNLRGDKFLPCRASGEVPMYLAYQSASGDNADILESFKEGLQIPQAAIMENAEHVTSLIERARDIGGGLQSQRETLSYGMKVSLEELSKRMVRLGKSSEEVADAIGERVPASLSSAASTHIYSKLEPENAANLEMRLQYAAQKVVEYVALNDKNNKPDEKGLENIIMPLLPGEKTGEMTAKNLGIIFRAASHRADLTFGEKVQKVFDTIQSTIGLIPDAIVRMASSAKEAKNAAKGLLSPPPEKEGLFSKFRRAASLRIRSSKSQSPTNLSSGASSSMSEDAPKAGSLLPTSPDSVPPSPTFWQDRHKEGRLTPSLEDPFSKK